MKHVVYPTYLGLIAVVVLFNLGARRLPLRGRVVGLVNVLWALATTYFMFVASEPWDSFHDFRVGYYRAARLVFTNPAAMYGINELTFVNLPIVALVFSPLAAFDTYPAAAMFTVLGVAAVAAGWWMLVRLAALTGWRRWVLAGLFVLSGPLAYSARHGNATHLLLPVLAGALLCLQSQRQVGTGLLLAAAAIIKPPLMLLPAYFGLRRRWRVAVPAAAVVGLAAVASLLLFGLEVNRVWYERCIRPFAGRPMPAYNGQSIPCALARQVTDHDLDGLDAWLPMTLGPRVKTLNTTVIGLLALGCLLLCLRQGSLTREATDLSDFCLVLCLTLFISPVCWTHYYLLLLIPAALGLGGQVGVPARAGWLSAAGLAFLLMSLPVRGWASGPWWVRLAASHYLLGGLLLLGTLALARLRITRPAGGFIIPDRALPLRAEPRVLQRAS
jgi:hypothetical protein